MLSISLQTRSRTRRRAFADASALSTFTGASANACMYAQQCADADVSLRVRAFMGEFMETFSSAHLCCAACSHNRFLSQANGGEKGRAAGCHTGA